MPNILTASWLEIPPWFDEVAPGAAEAARLLSNDPQLTEAQRQRLQRLVGETELAWRELPIRRHKSKRELSEDQLREAQHELLTTAFYAADFLAIGKRQIKHAKQRLQKIGATATKLSRDITELRNNFQLSGLWSTYRNNRRHDDAFLRTLPDDLSDVAEALAETLGRVGDFFQCAVPRYKPEGPALPVGQPKSQRSLLTTVINKIASVCEKHFGTPLHTTVARLANASLGRNDIDRSTAQGALRTRRNAGRRTVD
jgi:hypothetical protein